MKVALVRTPGISPETGAPIGLAYVQGALWDHESSIFDFSSYRYSGNAINNLEIILNFKPDVVGFHLTYGTTKSSIELARLIKSHGIRVIVGGPDATYMTDYLQSLHLFNSIVRGYGEKSVDTAIRNIFNTSVVYESNLKKDVNYIPDFTGTSPKDYGGRIPIITTRGCPHNCKFCSQRFKYYYHSIDSVLKQITATPDPSGLMINDSNFNLNPSRTKDLLKEISGIIGSRSLHIFGMEIHKRFYEYIDEFAACNVSEVRVGIESGSILLRREMNKPHFENHTVVNMIRAMNDCGASVWAQFILAYPAETDTHRMETAKLMYQITNAASNVQIYWFRFVVHHGLEKFFKNEYGIRLDESAKDRFSNPNWYSESYPPGKIPKIVNQFRPLMPPGVKIYA